MVEFAVVCLFFCTVVAGIIDLGLAFYVRQVVTNASREGARYGVIYQVDASYNRLHLDSLNPTISDYVLNTLNYKDLLPSDPLPVVLPSGPGYPMGNCGDELDVTVTATKTWFILNNFIPSLGSSKTLSDTTAMRCE